MSVAKIYSIDDMVEVVGHSDHKLPPILEDRTETLEGKVVDVLQGDLYRVEIDLPFGEGSKTALTIVQLHADQIQPCEPQ